MTAKYRAFSDEDYLRMGQRHGSDDVATEGEETLARWTADLAVLTKYGFGQATLSGVEALLGKHAQARQDRAGLGHLHQGQ